MHRFGRQKFELEFRCVCSPDPVVVSIALVKVDVQIPGERRSGRRNMRTGREFGVCDLT